MGGVMPSGNKMRTASDLHPFPLSLTILRSRWHLEKLASGCFEVLVSVIPLFVNCFYFTISLCLYILHVQSIIARTDVALEIVRKSLDILFPFQPIFTMIGCEFDSIYPFLVPFI